MITQNYRRATKFGIRSKETSKTHNQLSVVAFRLTVFHLHCRSSPVDRQLAGSMFLETEYYVACGDIGNGENFLGVKQLGTFGSVRAVYLLR